jgi:uncharacterized protein YcbK (DUF882 family)
MMKSENMENRDSMTAQVTLADLILSPLADREGIDNRPPEAAMGMLKILLDKVIQPIERLIDKPLRIVSGYRSVALNRLVRGRRHSHHIIGCAADISVGSRTENRQLYHQLRRLAREGRVRYTALEADARYRWLHIAYVPTMLFKGNKRFVSM